MPMKSWTSHFFATALCLGGLLGVGMSFLMTIAVFVKASGTHMVVSAALAVAFIAMFAWALHVGMLLFTGNPKGWRWAIAIFASQIPIVADKWVRFEWFTGVRVDELLKAMGDNLSVATDVHLGSNSFLVLLDAHSPTYYGEPEIKVGSPTQVGH